MWSILILSRVVVQMEDVAQALLSAMDSQVDMPTTLSPKNSHHNSIAQVNYDHQPHNMVES